MNYRTIDSTVAGCFYGQLRAFGKLVHRDGEVAHREASKLYARLEPGEEANATKMRADLAAYTPAAFASQWDHLVRALDQRGFESLYAELHAVFGKIVDEGFEKRAQKKRH